MQSVAPPEPAATARPTLHRWSVAAAAVAILVVAFGLRTYVAGLIVDANLVFGRDGGLALAQALQSLPDIAWLQTHDVDPPLYQLLLGIWVPLAGLSPFAVKFLGVLASTFGVAATYSVGRIVAGPAVGLLRTGEFAALCPLRGIGGALARLLRRPPPNRSHHPASRIGRCRDLVFIDDRRTVYLAILRARSRRSSHHGRHARALDQPERSFTVFVHLLDADGRRVAGHDGGPAAGAAPTDAWTAGDTVRDRHGLLLPSHPAAGSYRLIAGMYDQQGRVELESGATEIELGILVIP